MKTLHTIYTSFAKRTAIILTLLLTLGVTSAWAAEYSLTPNQVNTGLNNTQYITSLTEFTYNGITWKMNQWNPSTLQIKTNQSTKTNEFHFYNTTAFPGKITKVVITFKALTVSNENGFMFIGGTSVQTGTSNGTSGKWDANNKTITWTPAASDNFTFFAFYQNGKVASGTNNLAESDAIVVTYESGYAVTWDKNGRGDVSDVSKFPTTASSLTLQSLSATGYTNTGWEANVAVKNGSNTISAETLINNETTVTLTQATTFTAQWSAKTYTITLNNQSANIAGTTSITATYNSNENLINKITIPQKNYHNFGGYYTQTNGNGTQLIDSEGNINANAGSYTDANKLWKYDGGVTLYAKWTEKGLTNYRTTCAAQLPPTLTASKSSLAFGTVTANTSVQETFTLTGSNLTAIATLALSGIDPEMFKLSSTSVTPSEGSINQVITVTYTPTATGSHNATLTISSAGADDVMVTLSGTGIAPTANYTVKHYQQNIADDNYTLFESENGTAVVGINVTPEVNNYDGFTAPEKQTIEIVAGDNTINYYYTRNSYTLTWDVNEGNALTGSYTSGSVKYGAAITKPADPTREGHVFKGWHNGTSIVTPATTMPAAKTTYTAQWTQLHTITWMVGSNPVLTEEVANNKGVTKTPDNPANNAIGNCANAFMGWTETPLGSTEGQSAPADLCTAAQMKSKHTSVTGDKTFYAVFATEEGGGENTAQVFATSSLGTTNSVTTGFAISAEADKKEGYYQDGSGTKRYVQVIKSNVSTPMFANTPTSVTITAKLGGGSTRNDLTNSVYAIWLDKDGEELGNAVLITDKITATTGSDFTVNLPIANATSAYGVRVYHQKETSYNVRYYAISLSYKYNNTTYSNYVTNCCALACATNLTVSGTTAESATLTWTAPSPTTGITKLQVRDENGNVKVDDLAANATTATITGLKECTEYTFCIASVGEDCEVVSNTVTATPFSGAKTVNYDYNGGSGSVASFTTNCNEQEIRLPSANRTGYTFKGWYDPEENKVGDAGAPYDPATSPITLHAQWTINQYTVTWNPDGGNWDGSTSNIVQTYEYGATIDIPEDPKRENGIFKGWNPEPASTMPAGNKTYTAQWDMVYTLTFVDMNAGGTTSTLTQASSEQNIVAPTANSEVCDMWTFIGWAPSNSLNGGTDKPADFIAAGETILGSQIKGNKTYYSVYSYNSDNTQEFEVGKSGTYLMYALSSGTKYYATTAKTGGFYGNPETSFATYGGPSKFTLTYNKTEEKYIIYHENTTSGKESQGYFELDTNDGDVDVKSETPSLFTIQAGSNESFIIRTDYTDSNGNFKERSFGYDGNFTDYSGDKPVYFEPASEIQYYNAANCGEVQTFTMSFHNPFGDENALIWYDVEHEKSYYTDKPLNTSIDVFPTMVYNGWAFIGWTADQQYNAWIGEENLDDENSATDDPADWVSINNSHIYSTEAGWAYNLTYDVTMYPVFTKFEDNEPFDMVNGGDYYIYYIADEDIAPSKDKYGAVNRIYAGEWESGGTSDSYGATQSCAVATLFTFTKQSNGKWTIYDNTNRKYLCAGATDNNLALNATAATNGEWTITVHNGNQVNAVSKNGYTLSALSQDAESGTFKNYATSNFNNNSAYYHRIYVGSCTERVYSSNPSNKPVITLSGTPQVTSTQDQSIRAQGELSISATKLAANGTITLTSDNEDVYFSTVKDANFTQATKPLASLTLNADDKGKLAMTTVYVHYKPTSTSSLGVQTATITATTGTNGQPTYATATTTAALRNLPADFVIAAKWGDNWYAMPANMDSQSSTEGWLIEVDDAANPTKAFAAPNTTKYGLKSVYTSNSSADRFENYGERLVFVENITGNSKTLYNGGTTNNKTNIQVYAQYANYYSDQNQAPRYEWIPTTTDLIDYTLTSGAILTDDDAGRTVSLDNHGIFGTLLQDKSYNGMVRLLPVDNFYGPAELQVVEWKQNSVSVMYTGAGSKATTKVGSNKESDVQLLSDKKIDHAVYSLATTDLTAATNQPLVITIKDGADATIGAIKLTIPAIVATNKSSTELGVAEANAKATSVVVLDGATLTASTTKYTYDDVVVYPGGKLVIGNSGKLGMYTLTLRLGSSWGAAEYEYKYPQFVLNNTASGAYSNSSGQINLDYVTTKDQYYTFVAPFDVKTKDIKYPIDIYGTNVATNNTGSFEFEYYDGAARAAGNTGWKTVEEPEDDGATLNAGQGYTFLGMPKKVSVNGATSTRQKYGIHRIPMKVAASKAQEHENTDQTVPLAVTLAEKDNDSGWNIVGNPYMSNVEGLTNNDIQVGELVQTDDANGNWTGKWHWDDETTGQRFLVIPSNDGQSYEAVQASNATLHAFKHFFVQIHNKDANAMSIPVANRVEVDRNLAPARYAQAEIEKDIEIAVQMTGDKLNDQMDFLINDIYSTAFEKNADFTKMMNATNFNIYGVHVDNNLSFVALDKAAAMQSVAIGFQVPKAGEYQLSLSDKPYVMADKIEALFVTDHEASPEVTTNLVDEDYTFYVNQAETNNTRFTVSIILKPEKENTPTGVDNINTKANQPIKFLYQDKIYILRNGMIYDTTGKQVITINK